MATASPRPIEASIRTALLVGRPRLNRMADLLRRVAPDAETVIEWKPPFPAEPQFVFTFSAHEAHLGFAPSPSTLDIFQNDLGDFEVTTFTLSVPYNEPFPQDLIRTIAENQFRAMSRREGDPFW